MVANDGSLMVVSAGTSNVVQPRGKVMRKCGQTYGGSVGGPLVAACAGAKTDSKKNREKLAVLNTLAFIIFAPAARSQIRTTKLLGTRAMLRHALGQTTVCLFEDHRADARQPRWEISVCVGLRGGAERTRTACQARSSVERVSNTSWLIIVWLEVRVSRPSRSNGDFPVHCE